MDTLAETLRTRPVDAAADTSDVAGVANGEAGVANELATDTNGEAVAVSGAAVDTSDVAVDANGAAVTSGAAADSRVASAGRGGRTRSVRRKARGGRRGHRERDEQADAEPRAARGPHVSTPPAAAGARVCEAVRQDLCRFAVGAATREPLAELARHAHACLGCGRYIDDVARVREWLEGSTREDPEFLGTVAELVERARTALARELSARLARDLWDLGHGRNCRPVALRRMDVRRLLALWGPAPLRREPWPSAVRLLALDRRPRDRAPALALATALDPLGLDVALSHIASLEHRGQRRAAEAEADRLLGLLA
jgi:hypothetical protein